MMNTLLFALLLFFFYDSTNALCSDQKSCSDCINYNNGCVWCGDGTGCYYPPFVHQHGYRECQSGDQTTSDDHCLSNSLLLSGGAVAGIAVAVFAMICCCCGVVAWGARRHYYRHHEEDEGLEEVRTSTTTSVPTTVNMPVYTAQPQPQPYAVYTMDVPQGYNIQQYPQYYVPHEQFATQPMSVVYSDGSYPGVYVQNDCLLLQRANHLATCTLCFVFLGAASEN